MSSESRVELRVPAEPIAPALARAGIAEVVAGLPTDVASNLELLTTEVVSNAVRHAGMNPMDEIVVRVAVEDLVRVEVIDDGPGFDETRPQFPGAEANGWGLYLVDQLATGWGVARDPGCTKVWFDLDIGRSSERDDPTGAAG